MMNNSSSCHYASLLPPYVHVPSILHVCASWFMQNFLRFGFLHCIKNCVSCRLTPPLSFLSPVHLNRESLHRWLYINHLYDVCQANFGQVSCLALVSSAFSVMVARGPLHSQYYV